MLRVNWDSIDSWLKGWPWVQLQVLIQGRAPAAPLLLPDNTYSWQQSRQKIISESKINIITSLFHRQNYVLAHRGGGEQKPLLWPICPQCTQLSAGSTAVRMACSCLYGMQLFPWCADICKLLHMAHSSLHGTQMSQGAHVGGDEHLAQGACLSAATEFLQPHSSLSRFTLTEFIGTYSESWFSLEGVEISGICSIWATRGTALPALEPGEVWTVCCVLGAARPCRWFHISCWLVCEYRLPKPWWKPGLPLCDFMQVKNLEGQTLRMGIGCDKVMWHVSARL